MRRRSSFHLLPHGRSAWPLVLALFALFLSACFPAASFAQSQSQSAERHYQKGVALLEAKKHDEAIAAFAAALKLAPKHEGAYAKRIEAYEQKINHLLDLGNFEEGLRASETALKTSVRQNDARSRCKLLNLVAGSHYEMGALPLSLQTYVESVALAENTGERKLHAEGLNGLGAIYRGMGEYHKADSTLERAASLFRALSDNRGLARVLNNRGDVYNKQAQYEKAFSFYEEALRLHRENGVRRNEAGTLASMATAYAFQSEYAKSLALDSAALRIYRELGDRGGQMHQVGNLGATYMETGNYPLALKCMQESFRLAVEMKDKYLQQVQSSNLGGVYYHLGDYVRALEAFQTARRLAEEMNDREALAANIGNIGSVQNDLGQSDEALPNLEQAVKLFEELGNKRGQAVFTANLATLHLLAKRYAQALPYFERALVLHQEIDYAYGVAETYNNLGALYLRTKDYPKARAAHEKALALGEELQAQKVIWEAQFGLGRVAQSEVKFSEAKQKYLETIATVEGVRAQLASAEQRGYFLASRAEVYPRLVQVLHQMQQRAPNANFLAEAFYYSEKGKARALLDLLAEAQVDLERRLTPEQKEKQNAAWQRIAELQTQLIPTTLDSLTRKQLGQALAEAERAAQDLALELRQQNPRYARVKYFEPVPLARLQKNVLRDDRLVLSYSLGEEQSYVLAITAERQFFFTLPAQAEIAKAMKEYLPLVSHSQALSPAHLTRSRALYQMLMQPAERLLLNAKRIIIIADGVLHDLPFEALVMTEREPKYLIEHAEVTYAPSATVLALLESNATKTPSRQPKTLLAFADPDYGANETASSSTKRTATDSLDEELSLRGAFQHLGVKFGRLKNASAEMDSIARYFPASMQTLYRRREAKEEHLKQGGLERFAYVHFATHGVVDEKRPDRSCLVLALDEDPAEDGFLQMREIYNLELNAEMVALSACQTAQGKLVAGEGLVSLSRAFLDAGARSVLGSLWLASDDAAPKLMGGFYRHLQKDKARGEALRAAKLELINGESATLRHPFFWAAFVLIGSTR